MRNIFLEREEWVELFFKQFKDKKAYFAIRLYWTAETEYIEKINKWYLKQKRRYPQHEFTCLANTPKEQEVFESYKMPNIFCNHNAFVSERGFRIMPQVEKKYDAIYNARIDVFKNHHLAFQAERLALLTYFHNNIKPQDKEYFNQIKRILPEATMLNWPNHPSMRNCLIKDYQYIPHEKLCLYLNQAKVGLCLSAIEGSNLASMEYLLCGLPVVSIKSIGGRDIFFDKEYALITEDDPRSIKNGIEEMIKRNILPDHIRDKVLKKIRPNRERLLEFIQGIYDKEGYKQKFTIDQWSNVFPDALILCQSIKLLSSAIS